MVLQTCTETKQAYNAIAKIEQGLTIRQSLETSPLICAEGNKIEVIKSIILVIEFFLKVTGKELETFQIQVLAGDLYDRFNSDSLDDIILMFKMARRGEFGKTYTLDSLQINLWAEKYLEKKVNEREMIWASKKYQSPPEPPQEALKTFDQLSPEMQEKFNKIGNANNPTLKEFLNPKATEEMTKEKIKRTIGRLIDDD